MRKKWEEDSAAEQSDGFDKSIVYSKSFCISSEAILSSVSVSAVAMCFRSFWRLSFQAEDGDVNARGRGAEMSGIWLKNSFKVAF